MKPSTEHQLKRIAEALDGNRGREQEWIANLGVEWLDLMLRKNADYGSSVFTAPVLCQEMPVGDTILVRLSDKIARLKSLRAKPQAEVNESIRDTMQDLGAYALLWLIATEPKADGAKE